MTTLYTTLDHLPSSAKGAVIAIGHFDGVHLGHRALIEKARVIAQKENAPLGVLTFEPHARQFFQPESDPFRLTLPPMKQRLMRDLGVDHLYVAEFNKDLSMLPAEGFIERILIHQLGARHIIVGDDFAFGRDRGGTTATLENAAAAQKFSFTAMPRMADSHEEIYSSTVIRDLLRQAKFSEAAAKLGQPFAFEAPVIHGEKRGRELGFPTANQDINHYAAPPFGIYAVRVLIEGETKWRDGVANFGIRPMFLAKQPVFETFIFDFSADIYGKIMQVRPVQHLRAEKLFDGVPALIAQMKEDCIAAKAVLKSAT